MDAPVNAPAPSADPPDGILLRGLALSSTAKLFNRHDGTGQIVRVRQDMLCGDSIARVEEFLTPEDPRLVIESGTVVKWPQLPKLARVEYLVERFGTEDGKTMIVRQGRLLSVAEGAFGALVSSREASRCQPAAQG